MLKYKRDFSYSCEKQKNNTLYRLYTSLLELDVAILLKIIKLSHLIFIFWTFIDCNYII